MGGLVIIANYHEHDPGRYGTPWVAIVRRDARIDFTRKVGGYSAGQNTGRAGTLYICDPKEGAVYAYGQKDYSGANTYYEFARYVGGRFEPVEKADLRHILANT